MRAEEFYDEVSTPKERELDRMIQECKASMKKARGRRTVKCQGCGRRNMIKNLTLHIREWYDYNTGDPNGGFWRDSKDYQLDCHKCGGMSRYYQGKANYDREWKVIYTYQHYFKDQTRWRH